MQSIIETLQRWTGGNPGLVIGFVLFGALAIQVAATALSSVVRAFHDYRQRSLARERLRLLVRAAALRCEEAGQARLLWNGYRKFQIARKVQECEGVCSFYLQPHDRKALPSFKPGQFLTFQLNCAGRDKPVVRCYSISDGPHHTDYYRVTIKREGPPPDHPEAPPGAASSHFCDVLREGDIIDVRAPAGQFYLDLEKTTPVVLISAGVGITPMLSMANAIAASDSQRECWFFFGARNGNEHIHRDEIEALSRGHSNIHVHVCYSRPRPEDKPDSDYNYNGRVSVELFKQLLPSNNYEFYLCGPDAFMESIKDGLREWGVPDKTVFFEAFKKAPLAPPPPGTQPTSSFQITFGKSNKTCAWSPAQGSLLDLAELQGVPIPSSCRLGNCGSCNVAIKSGTVEYFSETAVQPEDGCCLTCMCKPKTDMVLDA